MPRIEPAASGCIFALVTRTALSSLDSPGHRKARGAFFTPRVLCTHLADWAIRDPSDQVLEPSCGEAAFLLAAARRLDALGAAPGGLHGTELHDDSVVAAGRNLKEAGYEADLQTGDFFAHPPRPEFDAVVGNPPYVRYQGFSGDARSTAREAALQAGVRLSALASSWAAFTVHAALFLKPQGRLGLVLPAELLSVNYAAEVRSFLMRRFARVRLVLFTERVFPGVQEEVVLLQAEGQGPTDHCELHQVRDLEELVSSTQLVSSWVPTRPNAKWTDALLPAEARALFSRLSGEAGFGRLLDWGETTLGAVTGNNRYFALSPDEVKALGLSPSDLAPMSPTGSRHLRHRLDLTADDWTRLGEGGAPTWLFRPDGEPSAAARRYIEEGEARGVQLAYKCRVRDPWWRTPLVPPPDLFVTYMNADTPRLVGNSAQVHHLNSVHGLYLHEGMADLGRSLLPLASLNAMTLLGAETVGRAYGGGLLKLEPREADLLPVPSPRAVMAQADALRMVRPVVVDLLRHGHLLEAVSRVDDILLSDGMGVSASELAQLRQARATLAERRAARGRSSSRPSAG
ncbi:MAG: SAM-dependent DNA methyltransferase [Gemmataceae bacterium]|nr:SAM-dependent DNA methyltransferase [Gemmataceae bacterium]